MHYMHIQYDDKVACTALMEVCTLLDNHYIV